VSQALAISLGAGVAVMALIEGFGARMLQRTIGADGPVLVPIALKVYNVARGRPLALLNQPFNLLILRLNTRHHTHSTPPSGPSARPPCSSP